jgi:hypothetical protein
VDWIDARPMPVDDRILVMGMARRDAGTQEHHTASPDRAAVLSIIGMLPKSRTNTFRRRSDALEHHRHRRRARECGACSFAEAGYRGPSIICMKEKILGESHSVASIFR